MKNKKLYITVIAILAALIIAGVVIICIRQNSSTGQNGQTENQTKEETKADETYQSLSEADRQSADIYAELYETSREEVAELYVQTNDWEQTGKQLEKEFFTISENKKYQMAKDGYSLDDIEEAEKLSVKTGIRAMELIQAKGKASDNKSWEEVKKEKGIEEEQGTDTK